MKSKNKGTLKLKTDSKLDALLTSIEDITFNRTYGDNDLEKRLYKWLDATADYWYYDEGDETEIQIGMWLAEKALRNTASVYMVRDGDLTVALFVKERAEIEDLLNDYLDKIDQGQKREQESLKSQIASLQHKLKCLEENNG
jgi:hypothetical protein